MNNFLYRLGVFCWESLLEGSPIDLIEMCHHKKYTMNDFSHFNANSFAHFSIPMMYSLEKAFPFSCGEGRGGALKIEGNKT